MGLRFSTFGRVAAFGAALLGGPSVGRAAPGQEAPAVHTAVTWEAPESCPSRQWVVARAEEFLGRSIAEAARADVAAELRVVLDAQVHSATATIRVGQQEQLRQLSDLDCLVVADAAAFVLASAIDPGIRYSDARPLEAAQAESSADEAPRRRHDEPPLPVTAKERSRPSPTPKANITPSSTTAPTRTGVQHVVNVALRGEGGIVTGVLPDVAAQVGLGASLRIDRFLGTLVASWAIPQNEIGDADFGGQFQSFGGAIEPCWLAVAGSVLVPLCGRVEGGAVLGEGIGISSPVTTALPWLALGAGVSLLGEVGGGVSLGVRAGLTFAAVRPRYSVSGAAVVHEAEAVSGSVGALVSWRIE